MSNDPVDLLPSFSYPGIALHISVAVATHVIRRWCVGVARALESAAVVMAASELIGAVGM